MLGLYEAVPVKKGAKSRAKTFFTPTLGFEQSASKKDKRLSLNDLLRPATYSRS